LGGVLGWYFGYYFGTIMIEGDKSGGLVVVFFALIGIPIGAITGFSFFRILVERGIIK